MIMESGESPEHLTVAVCALVLLSRREPVTGALFLGRLKAGCGRRPNARARIPMVRRGRSGVRSGLEDIMQTDGHGDHFVMPV